ncbi:lytic transglycosylase domain-containing protein [Geomonas anaerohicana]|uniref:Lytic transglycosylase domain-containing protein n=1 Tax=Geomonas anaerohicana TaxID=2798583 RepID=A0ABS0YCB2_9BACT|nr:lytic transglycosylase domain-containing protein [Geomonas anaerohicana]MBJ6749937.1 lytic transglycosylase domain-containing protein [Geomonas anaerohicana]
MRLTSHRLSLAAILTLAALSWCTPAPARADIYKYEDPDGTVHFTDAPTDKRFKIFMRDIKKDKRLRTAFKLSGYARNPAEFEPIISSCSREFGVDSSLVKAVIHAESGYNPSAVSPKGAQGLMQLMPKTAQGLKVADSFNPSDNIRGGVRYLRFLLDTFKGNESLAVAAYNCGLNAVAKYGGIPPYPETQTYVSKVLSYRNSYR